jgi:hypothetical protein
MKRTETFHLVSLIKNLHNSQSQNMFQTKVNISISLKNMGGGGGTTNLMNPKTFNLSPRPQRRPHFPILNLPFSH